MNPLNPVVDSVLLDFMAIVSHAQVLACSLAVTVFAIALCFKQVRWLLWKLITMLVFKKLR